jgi:hypothetical protein
MHLVADLRSRSGLNWTVLFSVDLYLSIMALLPKTLVLTPLRLTGFLFLYSPKFTMVLAHLLPTN